MGILNMMYLRRQKGNAAPQLPSIQHTFLYLKMYYQHVLQTSPLAAQNKMQHQGVLTQNLAVSPFLCALLRWCTFLSLVFNPVAAP